MWLSLFPMNLYVVLNDGYDEERSCGIAPGIDVVIGYHPKQAEHPFMNRG